MTADRLLRWARTVAVVVIALVVLIYLGVTLSADLPAIGLTCLAAIVGYLAFLLLNRQRERRGAASPRGDYRILWGSPSGPRLWADH